MELGLCCTEIELCCFVGLMDGGGCPMTLEETLANFEVVYNALVAFHLLRQGPCFVDRCCINGRRHVLITVSSAMELSVQRDGNGKRPGS